MLTTWLSLLVLSPLTTVRASVSQTESNGLSTLGTVQAPVLETSVTPEGDHSFWSDWQSSRPPQAPWTGVTRHYDFHISRGVLAPDGVAKPGIFVNSQFPGPMIECNWGDVISVTVHNNITGPEEGTALHWHGLSQRGTQWADGVPGVSHCPITPGDSFTYTFLADKFGSTWWHAHYSAQYTAGLFGPLVIHGPKIDKYDLDLGPVLLGDWYHRDYFSVVEDVATRSQDFDIYVPKSDNSLINGKNNFNCSLSQTNLPCDPDAGRAKFKFHRGKTHRLRLMNTGAAALVHFSIDNHTLEVIATDMTPTIPYSTDVVTLHVGQRTDVLVRGLEHADHKAFWMRSAISLNCSVTQTTDGLGVVLYDDADENTIPTTQKSAAAAQADEKSFLCKNDDLSVAIPRRQVPIAVPDAVDVINVDLFTNATGNHVWIQNNQTQITDYNAPALPLAMEGVTEFDPIVGVHNYGQSRVIRLVMNTVYQSAHPMHLHGHDFQVLAEGPGAWDGKLSPEIHNPLRRDTHLLRRYGHLVIQFEANNPGVWPYHCHIAWHASMGYNWIVLERPHDLVREKMPPDVARLCPRWQKWTQTHVVNQIDSGI